MFTHQCNAETKPTLPVPGGQTVDFGFCSYEIVSFTDPEGTRSYGAGPCLFLKKNKEVPEIYRLEHNVAAVLPEKTKQVSFALKDPAITIVLKFMTIGDSNRFRNSVMLLLDGKPVPDGDNDVQQVKPYALQVRSTAAVSASTAGLPPARDAPSPSHPKERRGTMIIQEEGVSDRTKSVFTSRQTEHHIDAATIVSPTRESISSSSPTAPKSAPKPGLVTLTPRKPVGSPGWLPKEAVTNRPSQSVFRPAPAGEPRAPHSSPEPLSRADSDKINGENVSEKEALDRALEESRRMSGVDVKDDDVIAVVPVGEQTGLVNLGNTCYMNAVLQALISCECFAHDLMSEELRERYGKEGTLYGEMVSVVRAVQCADALVRPGKLKEAIAAVAPQFDSYAQQDAHEFLTETLDQLHQSLATECGPPGSGSNAATPVKPPSAKAEAVEDSMSDEVEVNMSAPPAQRAAYQRIPGVLNSSSSSNGGRTTASARAAAAPTPKTSPQSERAKQEIKQCSPVERGKPEWLCPPARNFVFDMEYLVRCDECQDESRRCEVFRDLSLDIPDTTAGLSRLKKAGKRYPLRNLLIDYFGSETVERKCEKCSHPTAQLSHRLAMVPRAIVLHVKRFRGTAAHNYEKRSDSIDVPLELDFASLCTANPREPLPFDYDMSRVARNERVERECAERAKRKYRQIEEIKPARPVSASRGTASLPSTPTAVDGKYLNGVFAPRDAAFMNTRIPRVGTTGSPRSPATTTTTTTRTTTTFDCAIDAAIASAMPVRVSPNDGDDDNDDLFARAGGVTGVNGKRKREDEMDDDDANAGPVRKKRTPNPLYNPMNTMSPPTAKGSPRGRPSEGAGGLFGGSRDGEDDNACSCCGHCSCNVQVIVDSIEDDAAMDIDGGVRRARGGVSGLLGGGPERPGAGASASASGDSDFAARVRGIDKENSAPGRGNAQDYRRLAPSSGGTHGPSNSPRSGVGTPRYSTSRRPEGGGASRGGVGNGMRDPMMSAPAMSVDSDDEGAKSGPVAAAASSTTRSAWDKGDLPRSATIVGPTTKDEEDEELKQVLELSMKEEEERKRKDRPLIAGLADAMTASERENGATTRRTEQSHNGKAPRPPARRSLLAEDNLEEAVAIPAAPRTSPYLEVSYSPPLEEITDPATTSFNTAWAEVDEEAAEPLQDPEGGAKNPQRYLLQAVVLHHGFSARSGHYVTYARDPVLNTWTHFDDSTRTVVSEKEVLDASRQKCYLLFYVRADCCTSNG